MPLIFQYGGIKIKLEFGSMRNKSRLIYLDLQGPIEFVCTCLKMELLGISSIIRPVWDGLWQKLFKALIF